MTDRILIIEADPPLRKGVASALTEAGFTVQAVTGYAEAMMILSDFKPGMVIMHEVLPDRDGIEACRDLHDTFDIPVILLGEGSGDEVWPKAVQAGADFYLTKPVSFVVLPVRVKAILRRYEKVHQNRRERP
ncbi:MAG: response regulator [Chloroflexota bacterium]